MTGKDKEKGTKTKIDRPITQKIRPVESVLREEGSLQLEEFVKRVGFRPG